MWQYTRSTGTLTDSDGASYSGGYSGNGQGLNNPAMSDVQDVGPLPAGLYTIGVFADRPVVGEFAAPLDPDADNQMFGRSGFFMHGDNPAADHTASDGCIVLPRAVREAVAASGDIRLQVV